ncbi:MAG: DNA internalization-related competence protein ComEC/Rec2 [Geobacter sp.]|nr:MAG: DNA internalization-related competence protein ComEC/Rec2 [Geobacter sp.]
MLRQRPLLIPFLALAAGLTVADVTSFLLPLPVVAAVLFCLALSAFIRNRLPLDLFTFLFFFLWGLYALTPWKSPPLPAGEISRYAGPEALIVEGIVASRPSTTPTGSSFVMDVESVLRERSAAPSCGNLMIFVPAGEAALARGDRVRLATRIVVPQKLGLPGEFDYPRYLSYQGISAIGRVASADEIVLMRGAAEDSLLRRIDLVAKRLGDFIRTAVPDGDVSSVLTALLLGDMKQIPKSLNQAYTNAGVNHILSISGFHVGIIAYFIAMVALFCATRSEFLALRFNLRRSVLLLAVPVMVLYLVLTGTAPATARSVVMLVTFVLALYIERESDPVNALLISAFLLVAINPPSLFEISFQLSFLALWGIVIAVPAVTERIKSLEKPWQRNLISFTAASCAASIATAVPVLLYFDQASLNGILANFLIGPLLGYGAVLTGFCALPFVYIYAPLANSLLWLAGKLTAIANALVMVLAKLPLLHYHGIGRLDLLVLVAVMFALTFIRSRRINIALCAILPLAAVIAHIAAPSREDGRLHITMLSVGQGESLLLRLPDGTTMLVDGGGYLHENGNDFGERTLAPALFKLGVKRIDRMVLTHSHPDHVGGLPYVARTFPVGEFWEAAPGGVGDQYDQLRAILDDKKVPRRLLAAGDVLKPGGNVALEVLWPLPPGAGPTRATDEAALNDESLVFRLEYGKFAMLFTADAGAIVEERLLADGADIAAAVLKIGHHGSRYATSGAFLDQVSPRAALISVGSNNFGLPSAATLGLLRRHGLTTYRTDRDGTIEVVSDGSTWSMLTPWRP